MVATVAPSTARESQARRSWSVNELDAKPIEAIALFIRHAPYGGQGTQVEITKYRRLEQTAGCVRCAVYNPAGRLAQTND